MKGTKEQNFERELPAGYKQVLHINAKDKKIGLIFNLIAFAVLIVVMAVAFLLASASGMQMSDITDDGFFVAYIVFLVSMVAYIVLHELIHGVAYKALTGEKLTFGISWSCAFCGVPDIFTYRKTAVIALLAPFISFTVLFVPLLAVFYAVSPLYFLLFSFVFGLHLGGCCGDVYTFILFAVKFKDKKTLMRDTGPEQFMYVPDDNVKV